MTIFQLCLYVLVVSDCLLGPLLLLLLTEFEEFLFLELVDGGGATFVRFPHRLELVVKRGLEGLEISFSPSFPTRFKLRDRLVGPR